MMQKIITVLVGIGLLFILFFTLTQSFKSAVDKTPTQEATKSAESNQVVETEFVNPYKDYPQFDNPDLVFFWREGCPHCKNVEDWISEHNATDSAKINFKEVYNSDSDRTEFFNTVKKYCPELMTEDGGIGVPVAFNPAINECIQGDTPIIEFLSSKIGQ